MRKERDNGVILLGCQVALTSTQGRYIGRHDKVLRELADVLEAERKRRRLTNVKKSRQFVRRCEATAGHVRATRRTSVLDRD